VIGHGHLEREEGRRETQCGTRKEIRSVRGACHGRRFTQCPARALSFSKSHLGVAKRQKNFGSSMGRRLRVARQRIER
jgi:hypothetical protein